MSNYWPANSKPSDRRREYYWLWEHEYDKHGGDFAHLVNIYQPEVFRGYNTQKLQEYFFAYTINFYKNQKLQKIDISKGKDVTFNSYGDLVVTKQSLGQIIDIDTDHSQSHVIRIGLWRLRFASVFRRTFHLPMRAAALSRPTKRLLILLEIIVPVISNLLDTRGLVLPLKIELPLMESSSKRRMTIKISD